MARSFTVVSLRGRVVRLGAVLVFCAAFVWGTSLVFSSVAVHHRPRSFVARGGAFYHGSERLLLRLVTWSPERPGEVPWRPSTGPQMLTEDFARIRAAGFNGVRSWGALTPEQLTAAASHGLYVLQGVGLDRHTRFSVPAERERELAHIGRVVQNTRHFGNIIGYVLFTEPSAERVHSEGVENARAFLREAASLIRRWDPGALVGFANGPGLESLDDPSMDFVAVNLPLNRATSLTAAVGYTGVLRFWRERVAGPRPLLLSEFGVPVLAPNAPPTLHRYSEAQQAELLPMLSDAALRAGVAGTSLSTWADEWWKAGEVPDDETSHDALDPNEWTGLVAFEDASDRLGRARPALAAMWSHHRAMVTRPVDGDAAERLVPIEARVTVRGELVLAVERPGQAQVLLSTVRKGGWVSAVYELPSDAVGSQRLTISVRRGDEVLARVQRVIVPSGSGSTLKLSLAGRGSSRTVIAQLNDAEGKPLPNVEVRVGSLEASGTYDRTLFLRTDEKGAASAQVWLPPSPARMLILGGVMPAEGDTPTVYDHLLVAGEAQ